MLSSSGRVRMPPRRGRWPVRRIRATAGTRRVGSSAAATRGSRPAVLCQQLGRRGSAGVAGEKRGGSSNSTCSRLSPRSTSSSMHGRPSCTRSRRGSARRPRSDPVPAALAPDTRPARRRASGARAFRRPAPRIASRRQPRGRDAGKGAGDREDRLDAAATSTRPGRESEALTIRPRAGPSASPSTR